MVEWIKIYWLQTFFGTIVAILSFFVKRLYANFEMQKGEEKKRREEESLEQKMIKDGLLAILYDRLYQACKFYIARGWITVSDLDNLEYLYTSYHNLGGNGTGTELYNRCKHLELKTEQQERDLRL